MAYMVEIEKPKCATCGNKATHRVMNRLNALVGFFCKGCATRKTRELTMGGA